jgi:O-antigen/teichoic acid export membrane protein
VLKKLVGYTAIMFGATAVTGLLSFGVNALGMRLLSRERFGDYNTYVLIYGYAQGFFYFGVNQAIQRETVVDAEARLRFAKLAYLLFALLCVVCAAASVPVGLVTGLSYALGVIAIPFTVVLWWCRYIVRSQLDAKREALWVSIGSLSTTLFQLAFLTLTPFEDAMVYGDFAAVVLAGVVPLFMVPSSQGERFSGVMTRTIPREFIDRALVTVRPNWLSGQVGALVNVFSNAWSRAQFGADGLGTISAMQLIWQFAQKPMDNLAQATLPGLVAAKDERKKLYREVMALCLVMFPMIGAVAATGTPLLLELMQVADKYGDVPALMMIMASALPLGVFQMIHNQLAVASGNSRFSLYGQIAQLLGGALMALVLTKPLGLKGLVLAADLGVGANALTLFLLMRRDELAEDVRRSAMWCLAAVVAGVASMAPFFYVREHPLCWLAAFLVPPIYIGAMFAAGILGRAEVDRLARMVRARRSR